MFNIKKYNEIINFIKKTSNSTKIIAISKMYDRFSKIKVISNLVIIQSKTNWSEISNRATFVKVSGQILRKMSGLFLDEGNFEILKNAKSFVCRIINISSNQFNVPELENSMGEYDIKILSC